MSRSMSHEHETDNPANNTAPFQIEVAERVKRLPPYLFARINAVKYQKRRAGDDVIDLGMGNPSDPPEALVIEKVAEAISPRASMALTSRVGSLGEES